MSIVFSDALVGSDHALVPMRANALHAIPTMKHLKFCSLLTSALILSSQAWGVTLLVNRGLPTANLNNAAGSLRSNVDWGSTSGVALVGDTFDNDSLKSWEISTIRVWTDGVIDTPPTDLTLWGGVNGAGPFGVVSSSFVRTPTTYSNGDGYQSASGSFYQLFQVDFAVNISLAPGEVFSFFLDGKDPSYPPYVFLEASNRLLSGSPQQGSDDKMLEATISGSTLINVTEWTSLGNGWDKASDFNVQVFGNAVPDGGSTLTFLGLAVVGLAFRRRR